MKNKAAVVLGAILLLLGIFVVGGQTGMILIIGGLILVVVGVL